MEFRKKFPRKEFVSRRNTLHTVHWAIMWSLVFRNRNSVASFASAKFGAASCSTWKRTCVEDRRSAASTMQLRRGFREHPAHFSASKFIDGTSGSAEKRIYEPLLLRIGCDYLVEPANWPPVGSSAREFMDAITTIGSRDSLWLIPSAYNSVYHHAALLYFFFSLNWFTWTLSPLKMYFSKSEFSGGNLQRTNELKHVCWQLIRSCQRSSCARIFFYLSVS